MAPAQVSVVDGTTNSIVGTIGVGVGPRDVAVNAATNRVYVSNGGTAATPGNTLNVIDGGGGVVISTVPVGTRPGVLAVNATTGRLYVANQGSNNVSVVDGSTLAVLATVSVGGSPIGLAVNPTTNHVLVALAGSSEAALIDGATNVVVATVPLGGAPGEVVALPAQGRFVVAGQGSPFALLDRAGRGRRRAERARGGRFGCLAAAGAAAGGGYGDLYVEHARWEHDDQRHPPGRRPGEQRVVGRAAGERRAHPALCAAGHRWAGHLHAVDDEPAERGRDGDRQRRRPVGRPGCHRRRGALAATPRPRRRTRRGSPPHQQA